MKINWKIFQEPYPFDNSYKRAIASAFFFGLFIFLFLLFFQPFGLVNYHSDAKTLEIAGYGLVTTLCLLSNFFLFSFLFPKWYSKETWTVGKNILYTLWMFFTIGLGNLLYSVYQNYLDLNFQGFVFYQFMTLLVGALPVIFSTLLVYNRRMKSMIKEAKYLTDSLVVNEKKNSPTVDIPSLSKSENVSIQPETLLLVKAVENYIEIHSIENDGFKKEIVRTTFKSVNQAFSGIEYIQKCHRSYLVNLNQVEEFSGNAQGLTLKFKQNFDKDVPVSRAYVKEIKLKLSH